MSKTATHPKILPSSDKAHAPAHDHGRDMNSKERFAEDEAGAKSEPTVEQLLSLKPKPSEGKKFAENTVYTLNHALVCLSMDLAIAPWVGNFTQRFFDRRINIWHAHDHDHHHHHHDHHHHDHHDHSNFWHWLIGEGAGDLAAVPVTVGMEYAAPGLMRGIQRVTEPIIGPAFKWSSAKHAKKWAHDHGFAEDSPEAKARAKELYDFEAEHLPQAFMWTASSSVMNLLVQRAAGNTGYWRSMILAKLNASLWPLTTTLAIRSLSPKTAQKIDEFNTNHIAEPITRKVSGWLGVDYESVQQAFEEEHEHSDGQHILEASLKLRGELPEKAKEKLNRKLEQNKLDETATLEGVLAKDVQNTSTKPRNKVAAYQTEYFSPLAATHVMEQHS